MVETLPTAEAQPKAEWEIELEKAEAAAEVEPAPEPAAEVEPAPEPAAAEEPNAPAEEPAAEATKEESTSG
jgi:hypothetical protein